MSAGEMLDFSCRDHLRVLYLYIGSDVVMSATLILSQKRTSAAKLDASLIYATFCPPSIYGFTDPKHLPAHHASGKYIP